MYIIVFIINQVHKLLNLNFISSTKTSLYPSSSFFPHLKSVDNKPFSSSSATFFVIIIQQALKFSIGRSNFPLRNPFIRHFALSIAVSTVEPIFSQILPLLQSAHYWIHSFIDSITISDLLATFLIDTCNFCCRPYLSINPLHVLPRYMHIIFFFLILQAQPIPSSIPLYSLRLGVS